MKRWTGQLYEGLKVHVDTDNSEWGRICDDVEILQVNYHNVLAYVPCHRTNILIPKKDICKILE